MSDSGSNDTRSSRWAGGLLMLMLSIPVAVALVTIVVILTGRMGDMYVVYVGLVGVVYGLVIAVYVRFEPGASNDEWGWGLIVLPFLLFVPLWFVGMLILASYNLVVHGRFALNL